MYITIPLSLNNGPYHSSLSIFLTKTTPIITEKKRISTVSQELVLRHLQDRWNRNVTSVLGIEEPLFAGIEEPISVLCIQPNETIQKT